MKAFLIITYCIISTNGKLIEKNSEKNDGTQPTEPSSPVRISRQAFYDDSVGVSREDNLQLEEVSRPYVRKGRYSITSKYDEVNPKYARVPRESGEKRLDSQKQSPIIAEDTKPPGTLIKKPIPKFTDIDYEDFQLKVSKLPLKFADSGEHEDEDFNVDDYEFDVNHDEFVGRGKPLEPRTKQKQIKIVTEKIIPKPKSTTTQPPPEIKTQIKVVIPDAPQTNLKRNVANKKAADKMKEDYYDDITTTIKSTEPETKRDMEDEFSDDNDDSKETTKKNPVRRARSPSSFEKLADKVRDRTANIIAAILSFAPLLPQRSINLGGVSDNANMPSIDPLTGEEFLF
jgi:hypothetical protein